VAIQESAERVEVTLAGLAQHPSHRLVDQIFPVIQEAPRELKRSVEIALADEEVRGDHGHAAMPEAPSPCPDLQRLAAAAVKMRADNVGGRQVDQVPVVYAVQVGTIEPVGLAAFYLVAGPVPFDQDEQSQQTLLMNP